MKQTRIIREIKTDKENKVIRIEVYYRIGGMNYFTSNVEPRGYYLGVTPIEKGDRFEGFTAFSGYKMLLEEAKRFSQKVLDNMSPSEEKINDLVEKVRVKNNLEIMRDALVF